MFVFICVCMPLFEEKFALSCFFLHFSKLLNDSTFHTSLLACALEVVMATYGGVSHGAIRNYIINIPSVVIDIYMSCLMSDKLYWCRNQRAVLRLEATTTAAAVTQSKQTSVFPGYWMWSNLLPLTSTKSSRASSRLTPL